MSTLHRVVFLGFSDLERKGLASALRLAARRHPAYGMANMLSDSECDLVVADADHPPSVQLVLAEDRLDTTVFVGSQAPPGARAWLPRPVDALHVMRELDSRVAALDATPPPAADLPAPARQATQATQAPERRPRGPVRSHVDGEPVPRFSDSRWPEAVLHPAPAGQAAPAVAAGPAAQAARATQAARSASEAAARANGHDPAVHPALPPAVPPAVPTLVRAAEAAVSAPMPMPPTLDLELPLNGTAAGRPPHAPARPLPHAPALLLQPSRRVAEPPPPPPNALIVDDSEIAREFLGQRLHRWGLHCDLVADSATALEQLARSDYAFVFLDVDLGPQSALDGLMLCQHIKRHPRVAGVAPPVVAMVSAHAGHIDRARGTLAGCDAYLGKPLDEEALLRLLRGHGLPPPRPRAEAARSPLHR